MKTLNSISTKLILLSAILFVALYFVLSYYNRPVSDDVYLVSKIKSQSIFDLLGYTYQNWSGRWTSGIYFLLVISASRNFENIHYFIFIYYCVTLLILCYSLNTILTICIQKIFNVRIEKKLALSFSVLFIASFYYFTLSHMETFWWICASFIYLQGIAFLLFGAALMLRKNKTIFHYVFITFSFIYVGASFELYTMIVFFLFAITLIWLWKEKEQVKTILIGFIPFCLSAVICFIAPGNFARKTQWAEENIGTSNAIHLDNFLQYKFVIAFGLALLWIILGMFIRNKKQSLLDTKKIILIASLPFIVSLITTYAFQFIILHNISIPLRAWTFTGFAFALFMCVSFLCLGYLLQLKSGLLKSIICIGLPICTLFVLSYSLCKQYHYTRNYANAYDSLVQELKSGNTNQNMDELIVKDLPESGMLIRLEIQSDYMKNSFTDIFELKKKIVVK